MSRHNVMFFSKEKMSDAQRHVWQKAYFAAWAANKSVPDQVAREQAAREAAAAAVQEME